MLLKKLLILFDADDVLENLVECWTDILNNRYGLNVEIGNILSWTISDFFPIDRDLVYDVLYEEQLWRSLSIKDGAVDTVEQLQREGHTIKIITASHPKTVAIKSEILLDAFKTLNWRDLIVTTNKALVMGDILVDDNPDNLIGGQYKKLLFDRPWNWYCDAEQNDMIRVYNFNDVYKEISKIATA